MVVRWLSGKKALGTTECDAPEINEQYDKYGGTYRDQGKVECEVPEGKIIFKQPGLATAEVSYRSAETQKVTPLRKISFLVKKYVSSPGKPPSQSYYVNRDAKLAETFVYWEEDYLRLRSWTKQPTSNYNVQGSVKCTVNGKPWAADSRVESGGGFSLREYDKAGKKSTDTEWAKLIGNIWVKRDSGKYQPGNYECKLLGSGRLLRTFRFALDNQLRVLPSAEQSPPKPGALATNATYIPDVTLAPGADAPYDKKSLKDLAFFGRPWLLRK